MMQFLPQHHFMFLSCEIKHHKINWIKYYEIRWAKTILSADVPPSKSLFVWGMMHGNVPSDDNFMIRGCNLPSMCNLCSNHVWKICDLSWSPQCKVVVLYALINLFRVMLTCAAHVKEFKMSNFTLENMII